MVMTGISTKEMILLSATLCSQCKEWRVQSGYWKKCLCLLEPSKPTWLYLVLGHSYLFKICWKLSCVTIIKIFLRSHEIVLLLNYDVNPKNNERKRNRRSWVYFKMSTVRVGIIQSSQTKNRVNLQNIYSWQKWKLILKSVQYFEQKLRKIK